MLNMIRIEITRINGNINHLSVKGHANSDEYGKDLVCAAVSAVITGGLNSLENPKSFGIIFEEGNVEVSSLSGVSKNDYHTLEVILTQLRTIEEDNKKYVQIIEKGN